MPRRTSRTKSRNARKRIAPDVAIMLRVVRRDPNAADVFVRRHYPWMLRYARRMIGVESQAELVVRDVLREALDRAARIALRQDVAAAVLELLVIRCRHHLLP